MKNRKQTTVRSIAALAVIALTLALIGCDTGSSSEEGDGDGGGSGGGGSGGVPKRIIITGMPDTPYNRYKSTGVTLRIVPVGTEAVYYRAITDNTVGGANISPTHNTLNSKAVDGEVIFELFRYVDTPGPWTTGGGNYCLYIWDYYATDSGASSWPAYKAASIDLSPMTITVPFSTFFTSVTITRGSPF
jgi:hypothetical protein